MSTTLRGVCAFYVVAKGGLRPPYRYGTKYTSLLRVFDTLVDPKKHVDFLAHVVFCILLIEGASPPI